MNEAAKNINMSQNKNSLHDVLLHTSFTRSEIQFIYRDFKQVYKTNLTKFTSFDKFK
jgi:hypothetical protein